MDNILNTLYDKKDFQKLISLINEASADFVLTESSEIDYTMFAPIDWAFSEKEDRELGEILKSGSESLNFLKYFIARDLYTSRDLKSGSSVITLGDHEYPVSACNGNIKIGRAKIVEKDIKCTNGLIHVLDRLP